MPEAHAEGAIGPPRFLRKGDFAKLVGVSPGRVSQMVADGLPVEGDGRIDVARGKLWIQANVSPTRSAAQARGDPELPFAAVRDASAERVRLLREQADHAALKNAEKRRELLPAAQVEREWASVLRDVRAAMLALPSRIQQRLGHLTAAEIDAIDREIRDVLAEVADG